jgi:hypothetical protein
MPRSPRSPHFHRLFTSLTPTDDGEASILGPSGVIEGVTAASPHASAGGLAAKAAGSVRRLGVDGGVATPERSDPHHFPSTH